MIDLYADYIAIFIFGLIFGMVIIEIKYLNKK